MFIKRPIRFSQERIPTQVLSHVILTVSIFVIFLCFKLSPVEVDYLRAIYAHPIKMQLSLFVEQLRRVHLNNYLYSWSQLFGLFFNLK